MNKEITQAQDERKMIPVSLDTHKRVMKLAGHLTAKRGLKASMETAVIVALDALEAQSATDTADNESQPEAACA